MQGGKEGRKDRGKEGRIEGGREREGERKRERGVGRIAVLPCHQKL